MLTRCPACQTVFRLRPEQLRARHGEVRCGHCFNPFNALEHLVQEAAPTAEAAPAPASPSASAPTVAQTEVPPATPSLRPTQQTSTSLPPASSPPTPLPEAAAAHAQHAAFFSLTDTVSTPDALRPADDLDFTLPDNLLDSASGPSTAAGTQPPAAGFAAQPAAAAAAAPAPDAQSWSVPGPATERVSFDALMKREAPPPVFPSTPGHSGELRAVAAEPTLPPATPVPEVFRAERRSAAPRREEPMLEVRGDTVETPVDSFDPQAPTLEPFATEPTANTAPAVSIEPAASTEPMASPPPAAHVVAEERIEPDSAAVDTARLDATYGRPPEPANPLARTVWGLAVTVLAGALVVQGAYLFREELSRELPGLRPLYVAVCEQVGCDMPLPRDAALFNIENSDLQSEPGRPGRHMLYATVRNRAPYPQAWPHLELTLTDAQDGPLARRVFTPEEWVGSAPLGHGFRARSETAIRLAFDTPGLQATGYRVYVFYP